MATAINLSTEPGIARLEALISEQFSGFNHRLLVLETLARRQAERPEPKPPDDELLDADALAVKLHLRRRTIREWVARGMPCRRINKRTLRFSWAEVQAWVASLPQK